MKIAKWTVDKQEGMGGTSGHFITFSAGFCARKHKEESSVCWILIWFTNCYKRSAPYLSVTLDQVLHVPFDCVQMFLDVVEVLNGLIRSHSCVTLDRGWADLFQRVMKGVSAETKRRHTEWQFTGRRATSPCRSIVQKNINTATASPKDWVKSSLVQRPLNTK